MTFVVCTCVWSNTWKSASSTLLILLCKNLVDLGFKTINLLGYHMLFQLMDRLRALGNVVVSNRPDGFKQITDQFFHNASPQPVATMYL